MQEPSKSLLATLQENHRHNSIQFLDRGCTASTDGIRCRECGLYESILFWTPTQHRKRQMRFRCPAGCRTRLEYDQESGSVRSSLERRGSSSLGRSLVTALGFATAYYLGFTDAGREQADRLVGEAMSWVVSWAAASSLPLAAAILDDVAILELELSESGDGRSGSRAPSADSAAEPTTGGSEVSSGRRSAP